MSSCSSIEPLVTPYIDDELGAPARRTLEQHVERCAACRLRIGAERSVRELLHSRREVLHRPCAPGGLRARCASLGVESAASRPARHAGRAGLRVRSAVTASVMPLALAAILMLIVGGAFVYRVTGSSSQVMAAELTADHVKCFMMNAVLRTQDSPAAVESSLASGFDWNVHLPEHAEREGLELVGSRPCLYGEGKVAHIMYRHNGRPVSLFMLPRTARPDQLITVFGHEAAIWSIGDRTFVLVAREERSEVERMAAFVHAAIQ
jgi:anti-sigma factor RsiW